jgi:hypothetical protein
VHILVACHSYAVPILAFGGNRTCDAFMYLVLVSCCRAFGMLKDLTQYCVCQPYKKTCYFSSLCSQTTCVEVCFSSQLPFFMRVWRERTFMPHIGYTIHSPEHRWTVSIIDDQHQCKVSYALLCLGAASRGRSSGRWLDATRQSWRRHDMKSPNFQQMWPMFPLSWQT